MENFLNLLNFSSSILKRIKEVTERERNISSVGKNERYNAIVPYIDQEGRKCSTLYIQKRKKQIGISCKRAVQFVITFLFTSPFSMGKNRLFKRTFFSGLGQKSWFFSPSNMRV